MRNKSMPLVTVVTITFNLIKNKREKTFRQCLESVHNQTYENIEHIVVDGASGDGTVELIKEYADKGWIRYISEPDTGIYDALNKGIRMAEGKYISFLNSDDFYHGENGIAETVDVLEKSGAVFSYAPALMMREDGSFYKDHPHVNPDISSVLFTMPFCHQTMFTRRDVMVKEGMFDTNFKSAGDYDFVMRLILKRYPSVLVENTFTTFRLGGLSDNNQEQSIREVAQMYYKNYNKIVPVTKEECGAIYCNGYSNIPAELAMKLSDLEPYFNYEEYLRRKKADGFLHKLYRTGLNIILGSRLRRPLMKVYQCFRRFNE